MNSWQGQGGSLLRTPLTQLLSFALFFILLTDSHVRRALGFAQVQQIQFHAAW
jgi:hypothetical protein